MAAFERLRIWQEAADLVAECYDLARGLPRGEGYALPDQLRSAAISVAVNIAEGKGRGTVGEFKRFLWISHGSLTEVQALLLLAQRLGFVGAETMDPILGRCVLLGRMINALQRTMKQGLADSARTARAQGAPQPGA